MKRQVLVFLLLAAVFSIFEHKGYAQIYVYSHIDVLSNGSAVEAECSTQAPADDEGDNDDYYLFAVDCTSNGTSVSGQDCSKEYGGNPGTDCSWLMKLVPGFEYKLESEHRVWFYSVNQPTTEEPPVGPPYYDPDGYTAMPIPETIPDGSETDPHYLQDSGYVVPGTSAQQTNQQSVTVVITRAFFTSIYLDPLQKGLFQTQQTTFTTSLDALQVLTRQSDSIVWCIMGGISNCSGSGGIGSDTIQGSFATPSTGNYATYIAPDPITGSSPFLPAFTYVCAQESVNDTNFACARVALRNVTLYLTLPSGPSNTPPSVSLTPGQPMSFTADVDAGGSPVSWNWAVFPGGPQFTTSISPSADGSRDTITFPLGFSTSGTYTATATATVDLSADGGNSSYALPQSTVQNPPVPPNVINITVNSTLKARA